VFLGRSVTQHKHVSDETARRIDEEIRQIIDNAHRTAKDLLVEHRESLELMAKALIRYETINSHQIDQIMAGQEPDPPEDWTESDHSETGRPTSDSGDKAGPSTIGGPAEQH